MLCDLYVRALVNVEQAKDALKLNIIVNITIPFGLIALLLEVTDGRGVLGLLTPCMTATRQASPLFTAPVIGAFTMAVALAFYSFAAVINANDLAHFLKLQVSEKSETPTVL